MKIFNLSQSSSVVMLVVSCLTVLIFFGGAQKVQAATDCTFTSVGTVMTLDADCMTDETIFIPNGFTLDGGGNTVTAQDPPGGHFTGAVVQNGGSTAYVADLSVTADSLANVCDGGADRLRGIMFEGASGSITKTSVTGINQEASGCQEGNAIEVRNAPFDGTHPNTQSVEISQNDLFDWQKTGIVCNGDVDCDIHHNNVGESATQQNLAPNSIQCGFGGICIIEHNHVHGNQWLGPSDFAATGILLFAVDGALVKQNILNNNTGNSDVGIFAVFTSNSLIDNNKVFDKGADGPHGDFGLADVAGNGNSFTNNKAMGFDTPYFGVAGGKNKAIPGPQAGNIFF